MALKWENCKAYKKGKIYYYQYDDWDNSWCLFINSKPVAYFDESYQAKEWAEWIARQNFFTRLFSRIKNTFKVAKKEWDREYKY